MDPDAYRRFTARLTAWAEDTPEVVGLVAVGSTAAVTHDADVWSDHDVLVVARAGAAVALRDDPAWLPDADRVVLWHHESAEGRAAVYDDGHLVELAVFEEGGVPDFPLNDHAVLSGTPDLAARLAGMARATTRRTAEDDPAGARRFSQIVVQLVIGLGRDARGEVLSGHERIKGRALTELLSLVRDFRPPETAAPLDDLDPYRRLEQAHPTVARRIAEVLGGPVTTVVEVYLDVLENELAGVVPAVSIEPLAAVRTLASRVSRGR